MKLLQLLAVAPIMVLSFFNSKEAIADTFNSWLVSFKQEAHSQGVSKKTLNNAFVGIKFIPRVVELDRKQPEFT